VAAELIDHLAGPAICFALKREAAPFLRSVGNARRVVGAPCDVRLAERDKRHQVYPGGNYLTLITGVGSACTQAALNWLLSQATPSLVIAAGFAGSLSPRFCVGDVLDCSEVLDGTLVSWPAPVRAPGLRTARLITVSRLLAEVAEKLTVAEMSDAMAVDMESAAAARLCHERGIPFACVRAISDAFDTALSPKLVGVLADGRVSPWRLAKTLAASPLLIPELVRLGRDTKRAARNLATALRALLAHTGAGATR
jgi:adenosylhomocysteine nucleosidase